jgi:tartrate dehydrogenase/decarboxylase/D-malate dehydrogenase
MRAVGVGIKSSPDRIGALCDWSMVGGFQTLCTNQEEHMRTYKIAAMGGDGIGPEVVEAGVQVLGVCAERDGRFTLDFQDFDWGSEYDRTHGVMMPADGADQLRKFDAILFGAVGAPDIPDHITLWGLRLAICQALDQYANVRPTRILPGITSPLRHVSGPELDWVIVRENSEGEYSGVGGRTHKGLPIEVAQDVSVMTRAGVQRIIRYAFKLAQSRPRKLLTVVTKSNAQRHAMVMWDEIAAEVAAEFSDVTWDKMLVDAMTMRMVMKPQTLDTIVATNLHADILSDLAAALAGSLGIAPTANINPERDAPSMFEPIHGSAFDITGKGVANPIATFWTAAMMLEHLGEKPAAERLMKAVEYVTADPSLHTPDLGGKATTKQVTDAVCEALWQAND